MSETGELIVKFRRGVAEDDARASIAAAGASVRRRMRSDGEDEVMLLVRVGDRAGEVKKILGADDRVAETEDNQGGFQAS